MISTSLFQIFIERLRKIRANTGQFYFLSLSLLQILSSYTEVYIAFLEVVPQQICIALTFPFAVDIEIMFQKHIKYPKLFYALFSLHCSQVKFIQLIVQF